MSENSAEQLEAFVQRALADGRAPVLRSSARRIQACLRGLAAARRGRALEGLSAFHLSAALHRLDAAAASAARAPIQAS
jgi:hypothetical protein